jgi:uncharacterized phage protein (TIGR02220 family)
MNKVKEFKHNITKEDQTIIRQGSLRVTADYSDEINEVMAYLNKVTRRSFKNPQKLYKCFAKGYTVEDAKKVIDIKTEEWWGTSFEKYLRPSTLFGVYPVDKFDQYLNQDRREK